MPMSRLTKSVAAVAAGVLLLGAAGGTFAVQTDGGAWPGERGLRADVGLVALGSAALAVALRRRAAARRVRRAS